MHDANKDFYKISTGILAVVKLKLAKSGHKFEGQVAEKWLQDENNSDRLLSKKLWFSLCCRAFSSAKEFL